MNALSISDLARHHAAQLSGGTGPVAVLLIEDAVEIASSLEHLKRLGVETVLALGPETLLPSGDDVIAIAYDMSAPEALARAMDVILPLCQGRWLHYCYNAEYLFFPFCETRSLMELARFCEEERRPHALSFTVDLYAPDLAQFDNGVDRDSAHLDTKGYFALNRLDGEGHALERQMDFFGGLKRRFEEHVPKDRRRIDRAALFRVTPNLSVTSDHRLSDAEYNTFTCPWHNSLTTAIASFRTVKALRANPGSREAVQHLHWDHAAPFQWHSQQLLDLGLMEPGQWF